MKPLASSRGKDVFLGGGDTSGYSESLTILELKEEGILPSTFMTKVNQIFSILKSIYPQCLFPVSYRE